MMKMFKPQFVADLRRLIFSAALALPLWVGYLLLLEPSGAGKRRSAPATADPAFGELTKYGTPEGTIIRRGKFILAFDGATRCPRWVLERLTKATLQGPAKRNARFVSDPSLPKEFSPVPADYAERVFDQGHLAAANNYGDQADSDATFVYSNCFPQFPELNRGLWRELEQQICDIVREPDVEAAWVLTAPIWWETDSAKHSQWVEFIGTNHVCVAHACGKTVLIKRGERIELQAWVMQNSKDVRGKPDDFRVSVDEFERQAGLDAWSWLRDGEALEALK